MEQSRQTPRVRSDAIRGSEILANWVKLGRSAVALWLSIGIALGVAAGTLWFVENTTFIDRTLWVHHSRSSLGMGGRIANLPNPDGSGARIPVAKWQVQRYTWRSYENVTQRLQESPLLGVFLAIGGTVTAAFFLRQCGRSATENQHIRGATVASTEAVIALARASRMAYDFSGRGTNFPRDRNRSHPCVRRAGKRQGRGDQGVARPDPRAW
jgi:hypothetical protein